MTGKTRKYSLDPAKLLHQKPETPPWNRHWPPHPEKDFFLGVNNRLNDQRAYLDDIRQWLFQSAHWTGATNSHEFEQAQWAIHELDVEASKVNRERNNAPWLPKFAERQPERWSRNKRENSANLRNMTYESAIENFWDARVAIFFRDWIGAVMMMFRAGVTSERPMAYESERIRAGRDKKKKSVRVEQKRDTKLMRQARHIRAQSKRKLSDSEVADRIIKANKTAKKLPSKSRLRRIIATSK